MKIAIYGSRRQAPYADSIKQLLRSLALSNVEMAMCPKLYNHLTDDLGISLPGVAYADAFPGDADLVLSIGGDGTFLRTAAWVGDAQVPIAGINTGNLGYLSAVTIDQISDFVGDLLNGNFTIERRTLIEVTTPGVRGWRYALNEVVMSKDDSASIISAHAYLDGKELALYKADGLIVATPTGSTAYNLSVGGPILQPTAPVWVVSPIAAHSLGMRPLVVSDTSELLVRVSGRGHTFRLTLDGRCTTVAFDTVVKLRKAQFNTLIVQHRGSQFQDVLRNKLMFN
jgi:NAD+ kinase